MHQQSFKGQGIGLPGLSLFFLWFCVDAQPFAIMMMRANKIMMTDLNFKGCLIG
jgi:hypothetical protein